MAMSVQEPTVPYEHMGATLLARQPVTINDPLKSMKDWTQIFSHLESRLQGMRMWRFSWWTYWAQLAEYVLPRRYHWLITANRMNRGHPINNAIIDSTATLAMQICAAGLWTGLTSPSRPWFKLGIGLPWVELDKDGQDWLEDTESKIYTVLAQSNTYNVLAQAFQDIVTFGTAPVIVYEDDEDIIRCFLPCAGEYYLSAGSRLSIDTLYREFTLTVSQIVEMFDLAACPEDVRGLWTTGGGSLEMEFVVAHAIEPNFAISGRSGHGPGITVVPGHYRFREIYWLKGHRSAAPLSKRGFHESPFMVGRWSVVSNDAYGRSPAMDALPDTKQLQRETLRKGEFIEKLVRPPMGANPELKNEPASIIAGNVTYVNTDGSKKGFYPLFEVQPAALTPMIADIKEIQDRINRCFFVDIFMAISRMEGVQPRNELELTKRDLERLQVLGPFINLFETEFAGPLIQRIMNILERRKLLKPMPPSLQNIPLKIDYVSIMKLAQQGSEAVALKDMAVTGAQASEAAQAAGLPNPLRIVNWDKWYRKYGSASNAPPDIYFTDDEVKQNDAARAKVQAQQHAIQVSQQAVQAAQALGNTPMGGNTALSALTGGGGAPST